MKLSLSLGFSSNPRSWPLLDGRVKPDGVDLMCNVRRPVRAVPAPAQISGVRRVGDVVLLADHGVATGDEDWVGLPIFTTRRFFHTGGLVAQGREDRDRADLKGKRVGVPEYQQTAALWSRGVLQHDYGVKPQDWSAGWSARWSTATPARSGSSRRRG